MKVHELIRILQEVQSGTNGGELMYDIQYQVPDGADWSGMLCDINIVSVGHGDKTIVLGQR